MGGGRKEGKKQTSRTEGRMGRRREGRNEAIVAIAAVGWFDSWLVVGWLVGWLVGGWLFFFGGGNGLQKP